MSYHELHSLVCRRNSCGFCNGGIFYSNTKITAYHQLYFNHHTLGIKSCCRFICLFLNATHWRKTISLMFILYVDLCLSRFFMLSCINEDRKGNFVEQVKNLQASFV